MALNELLRFIKNETAGYECVVEFGAGFFDKLIHTSSPRKIGIEAWKPFIDRALFHDCIKINNDFTKYSEYIDKEDMQCAMFIDSIEHLNADDARKLLESVISDFKKVIAFIPEGNHPSSDDPHGLGADQYETHRSTWYEKDVRDIGFQDIVVDPLFHTGLRSNPKYKNNDTGAIFAVWEKGGRSRPMNVNDIIGVR